MQNNTVNNSDHKDSNPFRRWFQNNNPTHIVWSKDKGSKGYWIRLLFKILKGLFLITIGILIGVSIMLNLLASGQAWCIPWDLEAMSTPSYEVSKIALNSGYSIDLEWVELWKSRKKLLQLDEILMLIYKKHRYEFSDIITSVERHEDMNFIDSLMQLKELQNELDYVFLNYSMIHRKFYKKDDLLLLQDMIHNTLGWYRELFHTMDSSKLSEESRALVFDFLKYTASMERERSTEIVKLVNINRIDI